MSFDSLRGRPALGKEAASCGKVTCFLLYFALFVNAIVHWCGKFRVANYSRMYLIKRALIDSYSCKICKCEAGSVAVRFENLVYDAQMERQIRRPNLNV